MINFDDYVNENKTIHNKNWPYIPDHPYRTLMIGGSGSGKTNLLLNLIENQPDIDKIYLYAGIFVLDLLILCLQEKLELNVQIFFRRIISRKMMI